MRTWPTSQQWLGVSSCCSHSWVRFYFRIVLVLLVTAEAILFPLVKDGNFTRSLLLFVFFYWCIVQKTAWWLSAFCVMLAVLVSCMILLPPLAAAWEREHDSDEYECMPSVPSQQAERATYGLRAHSLHAAGMVLAALRLSARNCCWLLRAAAKRLLVGGWNSTAQKQGNTAQWAPNASLSVVCSLNSFVFCGFISSAFDNNVLEGV